jgi:hypothetical protein
LIALVVAGCGSTATASPTPTPTPIAAADTASPTPTTTPTAPAATDVPTATPTAMPTSTPTASPTPPRLAPHATLPPSSHPLCRAANLVGAIMIWHAAGGAVQGDFFVGPLTSTSGGRLCYMQGTSEGQMVSGGSVIADSGAASAHIGSGNPYLPVDAGGRIYGHVTWTNWCAKGPGQPVTVALVLPNGLGRVVLNTSGPTPVPSCASSGSPTAVTNTSWSVTYP